MDEIDFGCILLLLFAGTIAGGISSLLLFLQIVLMATGMLLIIVAFIVKHHKGLKARLERIEKKLDKPDIWIYC